MTNITILYDGENVTAFKVSGHSGYGTSGNDIVCAAISAITQNACVAICEVLKINASVKIDEEGGFLSLVLPKNLNKEKNNQAQTILKAMQKSLEYVQNDYKKYVKVEVQNEI